MPEKKRSLETVAHRVAEEMQLLAEQKWLIEVISQIRSARNSLQIERLHLESVKARMDMVGDGKSSPNPECAVNQTSAPDPAQVEEIQTPMTNQLLVDFRGLLSNETVCNNEQLDLGVSAVQPSEHLMDFSEAQYEEYDEDDDDDDDGSLYAEDIEMDMNIFMNMRGE